MASSLLPGIGYGGSCALYLCGTSSIEFTGENEFQLSSVSLRFKFADDAPEVLDLVLSSQSVLVLKDTEALFSSCGLGLESGAVFFLCVFGVIGCHIGFYMCL